MPIPPTPTPDPERPANAARFRLRRPRLSLTTDGPAYLADQIARRYRDELETQRLPAVRLG